MNGLESFYRIIKAFFILNFSSLEIAERSGATLILFLLFLGQNLRINAEACRPPRIPAATGQPWPGSSLEPVKSKRIFRKRPVREQDYPAEQTSEPTNPPRGSIRRAARYFYDRFIRLHGSPEQIAWGAAVGFSVRINTPTS